MKKLLVFLSVAIALSAAASDKQKPKARPLTGYECARMERLVGPTAEILGMSDDWDQLQTKAKNSEYPDAYRGLIGYLILFKKEVLVRQQYELKVDFAKKCQAGKVRIRSE